MSPLERLFRFEVENHRCSRAACEPAGVSATHTSYALQHGYEGLIRSVGATTGREVEALATKLTMSGDLRDVLAARDSVKLLFGLSLLDS